MPTRRFSGGTVNPARETTCPPRRISPASAGSNPATVLRSVVLPQPLGPSRQTKLPRLAWKEMSSMTGWPR